MRSNLIKGLIIGIILFGTVGATSSNAELIDVNYGIKEIKIDKVSQMPNEKPFTYKGTTFVPLRFIAEKLGQPIKYDASTQTIFIGEFDGELIYFGNDIKHIEHKATALSSEYGDGVKKVTDNLGNEYINYLLFKYQPTMTERPSGEFVFNLNKNYTKFTANIGFTKGNDMIDSTIPVNIYADDKRVYAGVIERGELPAGIELDVKETIQLRIVTSFDSEKTSEVGLFNAQLISK
ncbi:stalk domain-containing protein [Calidifontibacillus oryziterrae]|uniref:stalk domain-containing protein n=1 Tax=Calidifontibacillus oryziterrae TaxID=1191699 RepID=UPI0002FD7209|nr:stalk domain-containing protein [Calidifontibacillus oryziterrae]